MNCIVINLKSRKDRLEAFSENNAGMIVGSRRLEAIDGSELTYASLKEMGFDTDKSWRDPILGRVMTRGEIGCFLSHFKVWQMVAQGTETVAVFEDDVKFLKPKDTLNKMKKYINSRFLKYDVLLFSGNNKGPVAPHKKYPKDLVRVVNCYCCTMYAVKKHYYDTIIENFEESIRLVLENPDDRTAPHDYNWFKLQMKDTFLLTIPLTTVQRESYSDIEERDVNYEKLMLEMR